MAQADSFSHLSDKKRSARVSQRAPRAGGKALQKKKSSGIHTGMARAKVVFVFLFKFTCRLVRSCG